MGSDVNEAIAATWSHLASVPLGFFAMSIMHKSKKKSVSGHMVQENARNPWGSQFEAQDCKKLTRPRMTQLSVTQASVPPYSHCLASAVHCYTCVDESAVLDKKNVYRWWKHVSRAARRHGGSFCIGCVTSMESVFSASIFWKAPRSTEVWFVHVKVNASHEFPQTRWTRLSGSRLSVLVRL